MKPPISYLAFVSTMVVVSLFLLSPASASKVNPYNFNKVTYWQELAELTTNNELHSIVTLNFQINAPVASENITFYFSPINVVYNKIKYNTDFEVMSCRVAGIGINGSEECNATTTADNLGLGDGYAITVPNVKYEGYKLYYFTIRYTLSDAVKQYGNLPIIDKFGKFYLLSIFLDCRASQENCPHDSANLGIRIQLPSKNSIWDRVTDGVKIVDTNTVSINSQGYYQIWWTDAGETENWVPFIWALVGAVLGAIIIAVPTKLYNFLKGRVCYLKMAHKTDYDFFTSIVKENKNINKDELKLILDKTLSFEDIGINTHFESLLGGLMALIGVMIGIAISPQSSILGITIPITLGIVGLAIIYYIVHECSKKQYYATKRLGIITDYCNAKQDIEKRTRTRK